MLILGPADSVRSLFLGHAAFKGAPEGSLTGPKPSNYFVLIKEKGDFVAVPVDQWVTFRYMAVNRKFDARSLEEAEAAMKYRRLEAEKQDVVSLVKLGDLEKQEKEAAGKKKGDDRKAGGKKDDGKKDEPDSDEEWKDVKAEKLKKRMIADADDGLTMQRQGTALDFKDEYKPANAEDWEHEIAADDDDLDMGDDEDMLEEETEAGGFGSKLRKMMHSPSVSGDDGVVDGELSDGGMGDSSLRQKLKRVLKKRIGVDSDDDDNDDEELSDEDDDDDVDALDAMASGDFVVPPRPKLDDDNKDQIADKGKKRKTEEPKKQPEKQPEKKLKKAVGVEATGVPSEEEIRALLTSKKRMLLSEIASEFKKRLKSAEDRKLFTSRVKSVAMLDPTEKDKAKRYLILKS